MSKASDDGDVQLVFKSFTGEALGEMQVKSSLTFGAIAQRLAESRELPAKKFYHLFLGVDMMESSDALQAHVSGGRAELIAYEEEEEESSGNASDSSSSNKKKAKKDKAKKKDSKAKKKKKDTKGKEKKIKKKKVSKKRKRSSSSSALSSACEKEDDPTTKEQWIADRLEALRDLRPPLPAELRVIRAQKEWREHKKQMKKEEKEAELNKYPEFVREAMQQAEEEAKAAGKDELAVKKEVERARDFALQVAKENGLYKEFHDLEDPTKVPLMFQQRAGLAKTLAYLKKQADKD